MGGESTIQIVQVGAAMLIGDLQMGGSLKNPRIVVIQPAANGMVGINFPKMIGDPDTIRINQEHMSLSFFVRDENLLHAYREAVSGLAIARQMPGDVARMSAAGGRA